MLAGSEGAPPGLRAAAHICAAFACDLLDRPGEDVEHANEAIKLFRASGDRGGLAMSLWARTSAAIHVGDLVAAERFGAEALEVCAEAGSRWGRAAPLSNLALARVMGGDPGTARVMAEEALVLHRELDDIPGQTVLNPLPLIALAEGDIEAAQRYASDMVDVAAGTGWHAAALGFLVEALIARGDLTGADDAARRELLEALDAGLESHFRMALRNIALLASRRDDLDRAATLVGASRRGMPRWGLDPRIYSEVEGTCRARLGRERADVLMDRGHTMSHTALVELALA
jgi:hypothetical protein